MKLQLKHSLNLCLIMTALIVSSCGKKENKVNSNGISGSSPFYHGNSSMTAEIVNQAQSIKQNVQCMNGYRLTNDVSFFLSGGSLGANKIGGAFTQLQPGAVPPAGISNKLWVGVSSFRDIMFVTQVTQNNQVVGYMVTLSFCEMKNAYNNANIPSIISNERALMNFQAPYG